MMEVFIYVGMDMNLNSHVTGCSMVNVRVLDCVLFSLWPTWSHTWHIKLTLTSEQLSQEQALAAETAGLFCISASIDGGDVSSNRLQNQLT